MNKEHFIKLKNRYEAAPINQIFNPTININLGACTLKMKVTKKLYVAVPAAHGLVAFKMLDDAAWGAANTYIEDVFLFTYNFNLFAAVLCVVSTAQTICIHAVTSRNFCAVSRT